MDVSAILDRLDLERRTIASDGVRLEVLPHVTRAQGAGGLWHSVVHSTSTAATADGEVAAQVAHYRALGVEFEWKVYRHDTPGDLVERLKARGFDIGPAEAVMVLDLSELPPWFGEPPACEVRRVRTLDDLAVYRQTGEAIFDRSVEAAARELSEAIERGSTDQLGYVAFDGATPVSVGRLYTNRASHFGGLYGGGTLAEHRSRGHYRATIAARARDAIGLGARYLLVDALPTSRPILERLGFIHLTDTWPCVWTP